MSVSDELIKLKSLLDSNILTQEEYDEQKSIILKDSLKSSQPDNNTIEENKSIKYQQEKTKLHNYGVLAIVFGFIAPLVSWIVGGIGMSKGTQLLIEYPKDEEIEKEKSLCKTGIIIGVVVFVLILIIAPIITFNNLGYY